MGRSAAVSACVGTDLQVQGLHQRPFIHRRCILPLEYQASLLNDCSEMGFIFWSEPNFQCAAACCGMLQNPYLQATKSGAAACCGMLQPLVPYHMSVHDELKSEKVSPMYTSHTRHPEVKGQPMHNCLLHLRPTITHALEPSSVSTYMCDCLLLTKPNAASRLLPVISGVGQHSSTPLTPMSYQRACHQILALTVRAIGKTPMDRIARHTAG